MCVYLRKNGLSFLSINSFFCNIAPDSFSRTWLSRKKLGPWIAHRESFENEQYSLMTAWDIVWNAISRHLDLSCCLDDSMISNSCCLMSLVAMWITIQGTFLFTYTENILSVWEKHPLPIKLLLNIWSHLNLGTFCAFLYISFFFASWCFFSVKSLLSLRFMRVFLEWTCIQ